jgi:hypothetical protein
VGDLHASVAAVLDNIGVQAREKAGFLECTSGLEWDIVEAPEAASGR